jgi:anti-sigma B factor antagonist
MQITKRVRGRVTVVEFFGDLDSVSAPASRDELVRSVSGGGQVLLDLSHLTYMSSAGLRVLLLVYREAVAAGTVVALTGLPPMIHDVMRATGFLDFFTVVDSVPVGVEELSL